MKLIMKDKFDYTAAMDRIEKLINKIEDPQIGIDEMKSDMAEAKRLIAACREYLRSERESLMEE